MGFDCMEKLFVIPFAVVAFAVSRWANLKLMCAFGSALFWLILRLWEVSQ